MRSLLLAFLTIAAAQAQEVVFNESGYKWVRRAVLVPRPDFSLKTATALTTDFLQSQPKDSLVQFLVITERWQAKPTPRPIDGGALFEHWLKWRRETMELDWTMAETTALGGSEVMRFRMGRDKPSRHVLKGSDPLLLQVDGNSYEILYVWLFPGLGGRVYEPSVFVRASSGVDTASAERVVNRLTKVLPWGRAMSMQVYFRTDAWFPAEFEFPYYCPLCGDERLPTEKESGSAPQTFCMVSRTKISCRSSNVE